MKELFYMYSYLRQNKHFFWIQLLKWNQFNLWLVVSAIGETPLKAIIRQLIVTPIFRCRCVHITDIGIGYISTMLALHTLYLRWCTQIRDFGLQHICGMRSMQILSLAGKFYDESLRLWNSTCCNIHIKSRCHSKKLADVIPTYVNGRAPNCIITCMHIGIALFFIPFFSRDRNISIYFLFYGTHARHFILDTK